MSDPIDIDGIIAVPDEIEDAVRAWAFADRKLPSDAIRDAWKKIGEEIDKYVAEKVADALRVERGGCKLCPAAKDEPHRIGCGNSGVVRIPVEKP
jgi:hypothetical protein